MVKVIEKAMAGVMKMVIEKDNKQCEFSGFLLTIVHFDGYAISSDYCLQTVDSSLLNADCRLFYGYLHYEL